MTNNYVCITDDLTIRGAMSELVRQAGKHDNISTIYVVDKDGKFAGTIELKDLIIARENDNLSDIISSSYPYVFEKEKVSNLFSIKVENEIFTNFSYRVNLFDLIIADSVMLLSALSNG